MEKSIESKDTFIGLLANTIQLPKSKLKSYGVKWITKTNDKPFNCFEWEKNWIGHLKTS